MSQNKLLEGKCVLVSGASRGLGASLCETFSAQGAKVAFNYSSDQEGADQTLSKIDRNGGLGLAFKVSVLDEAGLSRMVKDVEQAWGGVDILVNNAGVSQPLPLALLEERDWDRVMDVNVKGQYLFVRAVAPRMIRRKKGVILNIGSLAGLRLIEAPVHYSASKAAVKGLTEALCKELSRYNIRVNCLAPGLLDDGVGQGLPEHRRNDYVEHVALRRVGRVEEVSRFAAFLVSDRNTYMNGTTIVMDGGF